MGIGIGGILPPGLSPFFQVCPKFGSGIHQQRPQDAHTSSGSILRHTGHASHARTAQQVQQHRFCLIVPMMSQHKRIRLHGLHRLAEQGIARFPRPALAWLLRRNSPEGQQGDIIFFAQGPNEDFIRIGLRTAKTVVHMDGRDLCPCFKQQKQQCHAVRSAGKADEQLLRQIVQLNHLE